MQLHYVKHSWSGAGGFGSDCVILGVYAALDAAEAEAKAARRNLRATALGAIHDRVDVHTAELDSDTEILPRAVWFLERRKGDRSEWISAGTPYWSIREAQKAAADVGGDPQIVRVSVRA